MNHLPAVASLVRDKQGPAIRHLAQSSVLQGSCQPPRDILPCPVSPRT